MQVLSHDDRHRMTERLPEDLSALEPRRLAEAKEARDKRLAPLFRQWPALNKLEMAELHRLWDERVRLARHSGARRRGPDGHEGPLAF